MQDWSSRKATLIRWSAEIVFALLILAGMILYFAIGETEILNGIGVVESLIGGIPMIALLELKYGQRPALPDEGLIPPVLLRMVNGWLLLGWVAIIAYFVAHQLRYPPLETVVFDVVFFVFDVIILGIVVSLCLGLLRLNRNAKSNHDSGQ